MRISQSRCAGLRHCTFADNSSNNNGNNKVKTIFFSNSVSEREEFSRRTHATKMSRLLHGHYNCRTDFFASIKCTRCLQQLFLTLSCTRTHTHMLTLSHFSSSSLSLFLSHPSLVPSVPLSLIHTHTQAGNLSRSLVSWRKRLLLKTGFVQVYGLVWGDGAVWGGG